MEIRQSPPKEDMQVRFLSATPIHPYGISVARLALNQQSEVRLLVRVPNADMSRMVRQESAKL